MTSFDVLNNRRTEHQSEFGKSQLQKEFSEETQRSLRSLTPASDSGRLTPASDSKRLTPASDSKNLTPTSDQNADSVVNLPKFRDLYEKINYDKTRGLTKEEVEKAVSDQSLKPHERQMAELLRKNYDVIKPMGAFIGLDSDKLTWTDLIAVDSLAQNGITNEHAFMYATAPKQIGYGTGIILGSFVVSSLAPSPTAKLAIGAAGTVLGVGLQAWGAVSGVNDYYKAKPQLEQLRTDIHRLKGF